MQLTSPSICLFEWSIQYTHKRLLNDRCQGDEGGGGGERCGWTVGTGGDGEGGTERGRQKPAYPDTASSLKDLICRSI